MREGEWGLRREGPIQSCVKKGGGGLRREGEGGSMHRDGQRQIPTVRMQRAGPNTSEMSARQEQTGHDNSQVPINYL